MISRERFDTLVSFLLGASSAIVIFGAIIVFKLFSFLGFALALFITVAFVIVTLFMILALDAFSVNRARLDEAQKQTLLLEELVKES
ncbi:MAG: hypothetical protein WCR69_04825 [Sulfuricurvum sp.]